jgi:hypothetical protein
MKKQTLSRLSLAPLFSILFFMVKGAYAGPQPVAPAPNAPAAQAAPAAQQVVAQPIASPSAVASPSSSAEDWKGESESASFHFGGLAGLGTLDSKAGFALLGTASKKIIHRGFVSDINDSVSIEVQGGPMRIMSSWSFHYSFHLRWDFQKDAKWTLYAIGGFGGDITSQDLGDRFILLPRFGIGSFYRLNDRMSLRSELSREQIVLGVTLPF